MLSTLKVLGWIPSPQKERKDKGIRTISALRDIQCSISRTQSYVLCLEYGKPEGIVWKAANTVREVLVATLFLVWNLFHWKSRAGPGTEP